MLTRTMRRGCVRLVALILGACLAGGMESLATEVATSDGQPDERTEAGAKVVPEGSRKGGGLKKKLLLVGLPILGGGGAAAYLVATKNRPPSGGTIAVSAPLALMAATEVEFRSQGASDPDGDGLSYEWDFGDGTSGAGEVVRHVFVSSGTPTVTLKVKDGKVFAPAAPVQVEVKSVTGNWRADHRWEPSLTLQQEGVSLSGNYADSAGGGSLLPGSQVQAPATMVVKVEIASGTSTWRATLTCSLDAALNECLGHFVDDAGGRDYGLFRFTRQ